MSKSILLSLGIVLIAGCSLAPKYERPATSVADTYPMNATKNSGPAASEVAWHDFFGDARLQGIIQLALDNNRDLRVTALNVERVRALYDIQRTALIPSLNATADGTRQRTPAELSSSGRAVTNSTYNVGLAIPSYELDFFGRVASLRDEVLQQYLATEEAQHSAQISLISSVARQYLSLLAIDEQLDLAHQTLEAAEHSYKLADQTFQAGVSSELDLSTAESQRESVRASVAAIKQQRARAHNALVLLVGTTLPNDLPDAGSLATQDLIENLPAGLPSELLTRRPDILAAEHKLQAANANIGQARAAFFPSIKLTAFGGTSSRSLDGLFESGSEKWSFTPSITLPIFAAGRNRAQLKVSKIDRDIATAQYEKTIQTAFREVADGLATRATIDEQVSAQTNRVAAAQRRYDLSNQRFEAGVDSFLTVLLAQQDLFSAQQSLITARLDRLNNLTSLYAALGGGWSESAE